MHDERDLLPAYGPECCSECGAPFNDAEPTKSGLCTACDDQEEPWDDLGRCTADAEERGAL